MTTAVPARPLDRTPPAELTPAERATTVAAILAAGLLRHLRPSMFPSPTGTTNSQEKPVELT